MHVIAARAVALKIAASPLFRERQHAVPFDPRPPAVTSGLRIGASPLATRRLQEDDFHEIGKIITEALIGDLDDGKRTSFRERTRALVQRYPLYPQLAPTPQVPSPEGR